MIQTLKLHVILAFIILAPYFLWSQNNDHNESKTQLSIEIDPATFAFGGYSAHIRIQPKNSEHILFGVGLYALDMPSFLVDINKKNKNKDWEVRLNLGYGLFMEHYFSEVNKKWFVGGQLAIQEYKIENKTVAGSEKFTNSLVMGYGGYTWQPFKLSLYIKGWAGIGYSSKLSGKNTLGGQEYDISPIMMFATFHVGYTF